MALWVFKLLLTATIVSLVMGQLTDECDTKCSGPNDVCRKCATACPATCDNPIPKGACIALCRVDTCVCTNNTVRAPNGRCVHPSKCPKKSHC